MTEYTSFFPGHNEAAVAETDTNGITVTNEKIVFHLNEEDFDGMADKTIVATLITMAVIAIVAFVTAVIGLPGLLLILLGAPAVVLHAVLIPIAAVIFVKTDALNEKIIIPAAIKMSVAYASVHRKVKSFFAKKNK